MKMLLGYIAGLITALSLTYEILVPTIGGKENTIGIFGILSLLAVIIFVLYEYFGKTKD